MKLLKRTSIVLLIVVGLLLVFPWVSGNPHLYKAVPNTMLKGRMGPVINERHIFPDRTIENGTPQPWHPHSDYNKGTIPQELRSEIEGYGTVSFVVIKDNQLLYEEYWDGFDADSLSNSWSMAKSVIGLLVGCAIDDGYISSVDQKAGDFLPHMAEGDNAQITIKNLLQMSSGIVYGENYKSPFGFMAKALYGDNLQEETFKFNATETPGEQWDYVGGNTILLSFILREATGHTVSDYLHEKIWKHLGAEREAYWSIDAEGGYEKSYCCLHASGRDFARLGQLIQDGGKWNGRQLVSEQYLRDSFMPVNKPSRSDGELADHYGYQWWMGTHNGMQLHYARGMLGQYIISIPEQRMVVVRLGHRRSKERVDGHAADMFTYIDAALNMGYDS